MRVNTFVAALALLLASATAHAEIIAISYTGIVAVITGMPNEKAGDSFSLTFVVDTSAGRPFAGGGGFGDGSGVDGGTDYTSAGNPAEHMSPVSAILTIDATPYAFAGSYDGLAEEENSYTLGSSAKPPTGSSSEDELAEDILNDGGMLTDKISASITTSYPVPFDLIPYIATRKSQSFVVDGVSVFASASFQSGSVSGVLTPSSFNIRDAGVSGAPEPSTWLLMIGGVGVAGAALRRRCIRSTPALG